MTHRVGAPRTGKGRTAHRAPGDRSVRRPDAAAAPLPIAIRKEGWAWPERSPLIGMRGQGARSQPPGRNHA